MRVYTSSKDSEGEPLSDDEMTGFVAPVDGQEGRHAHGESRAQMHERAPEWARGGARERTHERLAERARVWTPEGTHESAPERTHETTHENVHAGAREPAGIGASPHASTQLPLAPARDVSHEPRPAPPPTGQTAPVPPQIPTAGDAGGKS
jgi:small conductance mechanosensitive channel